MSSSIESKNVQMSVKKTLLSHLKDSCYCTLGVSKIPGAGIGVFAIRDIPEGTDIFKIPNEHLFSGESHCVLIEGPEFYSLPTSAQALLKRFSVPRYIGGEISYLVPATAFQVMHLDYFMNHSEKPNTCLLTSGKNISTFFSNRGIVSGEEITYDYATHIGQKYIHDEQMLKNFPEINIKLENEVNINEPEREISCSTTTESFRINQYIAMENDLLQKANRKVGLRYYKDRGIGLYATQDIEIGEILLEEYPLIKIWLPDLVRKMDIKSQVADYTSELKTHISTAYAALTKECQNRFRMLSDKDCESVVEAADGDQAQNKTLYGIFLTNTIRINWHLEETEEQQVLDWVGGCKKLDGVFYTISRANHSCLPNVDVKMVLEKDDNNIDTIAFKPKAKMISIEKIEKDQDIHLSYVRPSESLETRQRLLQFWYNFTCTCKKCITEKDKADIC